MHNLQKRVGCVTAIAIYFWCLSMGLTCQYIEEARITHYCPPLGGINCSEPCDLTAYMEPLNYGWTAACGLDLPYGTRIFMDGVGWRTCADHGGAITNVRVDVAIPPEECVWVEYTKRDGTLDLWCNHWVMGYRDTVWVYPSEVEGMVSVSLIAEGVAELREDNGQATVAPYEIDPVTCVSRGSKCIEPDSDEYEGAGYSYRDQEAGDAPHESYWYILAEPDDPFGPRLQETDVVHQPQGDWDWDSQAEQGGDQFHVSSLANLCSVQSERICIR